MRLSLATRIWLAWTVLRNQPTAVAWSTGDWGATTTVEFRFTEKDLNRLNR